MCSSKGLGVDKPNIIQCICYGPPWGFNSLIQQFGRCARDPTLIGECYCIYNQNTADEFFRFVDKYQCAGSDSMMSLNKRDILALQRFLGNNTGCLRGVISEYVDGVVSHCKDNGTNQWCSSCSRNIIPDASLSADVSVSTVLPQLRAELSIAECVKEEQLAAECFDAVTQLKGYCICCFFVSRVFVRHNNGSCHHQAKNGKYFGKCFHCRQRGHVLGRCPNRLRNQFEIYRKEKQFCYRCSFSKRHGNITFHVSDQTDRPTFGKNCSSGANDIVYELIWLGFDDCGIRTKIFHRFKAQIRSLNEVHHVPDALTLWDKMIPWMFLETSTFLNMSFLFMFIYKIEIE